MAWGRATPERHRLSTADRWRRHLPWSSHCPGRTLGQPVVIQNRPGANGIVGLSHVANSPPDGYTLLMSNVRPSAINPSIYSKLPYDAVKDFAPVTLTNLVPLKMVVNAASAIGSVGDLIARAKAANGKMSYGTGGTGTAGHLAMELFMSKARSAATRERSWTAVTACGSAPRTPAS